MWLVPSGATRSTWTWSNWGCPQGPPPLLADFIHHEVCKPICAKLLTLPIFSLLWAFIYKTRLWTSLCTNLWTKRAPKENHTGLIWRLLQQVPSHLLRLSDYLSKHTGINLISYWSTLQPTAISILTRSAVCRCIAISYNLKSQNFYLTFV